jgi:predicted acetyltransferase
MSLPTPPHLAHPELTYVTAERAEDYFRAALRGFYDDYNPELWVPHREIFEPERNFGFTVDGQWISTTGAYSQVMTVPGGSVPVAAVTLVTVHPAYRRRGLLRQMMTHQLEQIAARGVEPVALLWASEAAIYGRFGYGETTAKLHLSGQTRATAYRPTVPPPAGSVGEVDRETFLPVVKALHAAWLPDRPGALVRTDDWWTVRLHDPEPWRHGATAYRFVLHYDVDGAPDGYLYFRVKDAEVTVVGVDAASPAAYAALWRFALDLDLVRQFTCTDAPLDAPLRHLVADARAVETRLSDGTYARLVDVGAALEARRYAAEVDLQIGIDDPLLPQNSQTFRLVGGADGAAVKRSRSRPDLSMNVSELGAIYLGGTSPATLQRAGLITEHTPGSVAALSAAFTWSRLPFCNDYF